MKKYLGISTLLATSVLLTACTDDNQAPAKPTSESTTITSSTNSSSGSATNSNNSSTPTPTSEITTQSQAATGQVAGTAATTTTATTAKTSTSTIGTTTATTTKAAVASKINIGAISGGNLASVVGTYPAINGGTYTIKDSKTIVYNAEGQEKVLTITGYGQQEGAAVVNAVFSSIDGKPVDASTPAPGGLGAAFYFVPAGQASPAGFFGGNEDTNRDRIVTLNNAFYLN